MISVVIPTRHRNDLLARCLEQLKPGRQLLAPDQYEVIVTDDGSDSTAETMLRDRFPWVLWTAGPRRGPAANRNHGVSLAKGSWIAFTDDDCVPSSQWLAAFALATTNLGGVVFEGRTTCEAGLRRFYDEAPLNMCGGALFTCNLMVATDEFERLGGFDEGFSFSMEDTDFAERISKSGNKAQFVKESVVDHPPRRRISGVKAGRLWASRVYYAKKWRWKCTATPSLPLFVLKVRVAEMFQRYPLIDYPRATASMIAEVLHVWRFHAEWERQYRDIPAWIPAIKKHAHQ